MGNWIGGKSTYAIHDNPGSEIWPRRFAELSKTGRTWELNEENHRLKSTRCEEEYRQLSRIFGRYKGAITWRSPNSETRKFRTTYREIHRAARGTHQSIDNARKRGNTGRKQKINNNKREKARGRGKGQGEKGAKGGNIHLRNRTKDTGGKDDIDQHWAISNTLNIH